MKSTLPQKQETGRDTSVASTTVPRGARFLILVVGLAIGITMGLGVHVFGPALRAPGQYVTYTIGLLAVLAIAATVLYLWYYRKKDDVSVRELATKTYQKIEKAVDAYFEDKSNLKDSVKSVLHSLFEWYRLFSFWRWAIGVLVALAAVVATVSGTYLFLEQNSIIEKQNEYLRSQNEALLSEIRATAREYSRAESVDRYQMYANLVSVDSWKAMPLNRIEQVIYGARYDGGEDDKKMKRFIYMYKVYVYLAYCYNFPVNGDDVDYDSWLQTLMTSREFVDVHCTQGLYYPSIYRRVEALHPKWREGDTLYSECPGPRNDPAVSHRLFQWN